jgi:membrane protease YdiL (CAAX protease family)
MLATYVLLTLAILALWWSGPSDAGPLRRFLWLGLFAASVVTASAGRILQPIALLWIAGFALAAWVFGRAATRRSHRVMAAAAIVVLAAGLMTHLLPGFNNPRAVSGAMFTPGSMPYRLHLNFDKTLVGLFLLGFCHPRIMHAREWRAMLVRAAPIAAGTIVVVMALALVSGYVRFEPKFPAETWIWLWANLCLTCFAEEALFRGFVQAQLQHLWSNVPRGSWRALLVAAILFGFAHIAGGPAYVALASVAGIGYGWAYLRTRRIEASILTHFALNAVHFFWFTYPALQRG